MKNTFWTLVLTLVVTFFTSCDKNDDSTPTETLKGTWNLKNINGGFAGIDDDYETGEIKWTFNAQNETLVVENNSTQDNIFTGFESGTYSYSIIENNENDYLLIFAEEYGGYVISDNRLIINQNEMQNGTGADGFILEFER